MEQQGRGETRRFEPSGGLIQWTYLHKRFDSEQALERDFTSERTAAEEEKMRFEKAEGLLSGQMGR